MSNAAPATNSDRGKHSGQWITDEQHAENQRIAAASKGKELLSSAEKYLPPQSLAIQTKLTIRAAADSERREGVRLKVQDLRAEIGDNAFHRERFTAQLGEKADTSSYDNKEAALRSQLANIEHDERTRPEKHGGPMLHIIDPFINGLRHPVTFRNTTDEVLPDVNGARGMMEHYKGKIAYAEARLRVPTNAILPMPDIEKRISEDVRKLGVNAIKIGGVARMKKSGKTLKQGHITWPTADGRTVDAAAVIFDIFRTEITATLIKRAREAFGKEESLTMYQRNEQIAAIEAELTDLHYKAAYWWRKLDDEGVLLPTPTTRPECILDVVV